MAQSGGASHAPPSPAAFRARLLGRHEPPQLRSSTRRSVLKMIQAPTRRRSLVRRPGVLVGVGTVIAVVAFQLWVTPTNPPGFHRDEAALSYNAYSISTTLRDEDGGFLPLFFRSFDDYKSPLYPYLLAGVFRVTGPHAEVARGLSAVLVLVAVLLLGFLAKRVTGSAPIAVVVVVLAGL